MKTIKELIDRYRDEEMGHLARRTHKDYLRNLEILTENFGHFPADALKPRDIGRFMDVKKGRIQRGKIVSVLSSIYKLAVGKWYDVDVNPCLQVLKPKSKPRTRYVTDAEFWGVHGICSPPMQLAMEIALLTGQRQGDIVNMGWDQVEVYPRPITKDGKVSYGLLHVHQGKTGKKLAINITEALKDVLVRAKRRPPALPRLYIIRTRTGEPFTPEGFRTLWQRKIREALDGGIVTSRFTFHDIRAKSASDNNSIQAACDLLGHQDIRMTKAVYDRSVRIVEPLK
jgi:integrase